MTILLLLVSIVVVAAIAAIAVILSMLRSNDDVLFVTDPDELRAQPGFVEYFEGFTECDVAARVPLGCADAVGYLALLDRRSPSHSYSSHAMIAAAKSARAAIRSASAEAIASALGVDRDTGSRVLETMRDNKKPWKIAVLDDRAENGWPHTHGDIVCMPRSFRRLSLVQTLVHERVHVAQRAHPDLYRDRIAIQAWNLTPMKNEELTPPLGFRRRSNPDLDGFIYAKDGFAAVSLFPSTEAAASGGLGAAKVCLVDFRNGKIYSREEEEGEEHPYETQAYAIAQAIVLL